MQTWSFVKHRRLAGWDAISAQDRNHNERELA